MQNTFSGSFIPADHSERAPPQQTVYYRFNRLRYVNCITQRFNTITLGGICSGKSGVAKILGGLGAHNINCDQLAHHLYEPGKPAYEKIIEGFGKSILQDDGKINRKTLGTIVFEDPVSQGTSLLGRVINA